MTWIELTQNSKPVSANVELIKYFYPGQDDTTIIVYDGGVKIIVSEEYKKVKKAVEGIVIGGKTKPLRVI